MIRIAPAALIVLAAAATGCRADDHAPPRPGGGGGGGGGGMSGGADAAPAPDAAPLVDQIRGTVCALQDLRDPTLCAEIDLAGVSVSDRVSRHATSAAAGGAFLLDTGGGAEAVLEVGFSDATLHDSLVPVTLSGGSAGDVLAQVPDQTAWDRFLSTNAIVEPNDTGAIAVYVRRGGEPVQGANLVPPDGTMWPPYYDTTSGADLWDPNASTGPAGAAIVVGVPAPATATFSVVGPGGGPTRVLSAPVETDAVTFVFVDLPSS